MKLSFFLITCGIGLIATVPALAQVVPSSASDCQYDGQNFAVGKRWSPDGCNQCECIKKYQAEPVAICTTMICSNTSPQQAAEECTKGTAEVDGKKYELGCKGIWLQKP